MMFLEVDSLSSYHLFSLFLSHYLNSFQFERTSLFQSRLTSAIAASALASHTRQGCQQASGLI